MSSSILTNMAAMSAVQNLAATQKSLADTQNEISTGLKISSAQDDAAYWSISQTMRTNVSNLSAVTNSLNLGSSVLSTATSATNNINSVLQSIQKNLVSAAQPGNDLNALQTSINTLRQQLASTVSTASFNGVNMLDGSNGASVSFVAGVTGSGANTTINTLSISTMQTNLSGANYIAGSNALAKAATTADTAANAASVSYNNALSAFNSALGQITGGVTTTTLNAVSTNANATAGQNNLNYIFGAGASVSGTSVTGISATSLAGQLLGSGGTYSFAQAAAAAPSTGASVSTGSGTAGVGSAASTYNNAATAFNAAVAALTSTDFSGGGSANFKAVFGSAATISTAGGVTTVNGIGLNAGSAHSSTPAASSDACSP